MNALERQEYLARLSVGRVYRLKVDVANPCVDGRKKDEVRKQKTIQAGERFFCADRSFGLSLQPLRERYRCVNDISQGECCPLLDALLPCLELCQDDLASVLLRDGVAPLDLLSMLLDTGTVSLGDLERAAERYNALPDPGGWQDVTRRVGVLDVAGY